MQRPLCSLKSCRVTNLYIYNSGSGRTEVAMLVNLIQGFYRLVQCKGRKNMVPLQAWREMYVGTLPV